MQHCHIMRMTAAHPGAIGIVQLWGDVLPLIRSLAGNRADDLPVGCVKLATLGGIDDGLITRLSEHTAQLMPHGGPRVMQRLIERLIELGATTGEASTTEAKLLYPEAADEFEAIVMHTIAHAASPAAIDLLLHQPRVWRQRPTLTENDLARSHRLNRLVVPPLVVLAGPPNVGKSTLSNALLGRSMSIAIDMPGTTRDYTAARIELAGLTLIWHDTPGLRETADAIEDKAIELARSLIERADVLIAMTDPSHDWPSLPREADLRVASKADLGHRDDADVRVCAITGEGLRELAQLLCERLIPAADIAAAKSQPWLFDERLLSV